MIGIYAAGLFVLLLYDATGCGNACHRLLTSLVQAKAIREDNARVARQLARDGEAFGVRRRRRQEALDSRERFFDELKWSLDARQDAVAVREDHMAAVEAGEPFVVRRDLKPHFCGVGLSAEERFEHWTSPVTSVDPSFASKLIAGFLENVVPFDYWVIKDRDLLDDEGRVYEIPHFDVIVKPPGSKPT